ncbi:DUF4277 domain-containing protein [Crossiella sp. NPDC003009]
MDQACPKHDLAHLTHGQVTETLVANWLASPTPLDRVTYWAREWAVEEVSGIDPAMVNDDWRPGIGRDRTRAGPHRRIRWRAGDLDVRDRCVPMPLGHGLDLAVGGLRAD